jgi:TonB family protein
MQRTALVRAVSIAAIVVGAILAARSSAGATQCPISVRSLTPMPDGKSYGGTLVSTMQGSADIRLTLYSEGATYAVTIHGVTFDRKVEQARDSGPAFYTAAPIFFSLPQSDPLDAVRSELTYNEHEVSARCSPRYTYTMRLRERLAPGPDPTPGPNERVESQILVQLFPRAQVATAALTERNHPLECAQPYARARIIEHVTAQYPQATEFNGPTGKAIVSVDLAPSGKPDTVAVYQTSGIPIFDLTAMKVAVATTYRPEYFRCKPIGGRYLFVVDFGFGPDL